jgi:hypothetical protein
MPTELSRRSALDSPMTRTSHSTARKLGLDATRSVDSSERVAVPTGGGRARPKSRIYISYGEPDHTLAFQLSAELASRGHSVAPSVSTMPLGSDWRQELSDRLKEADIYIVIISESSRGYSYLAFEMGVARAYAFESGRMLILPIVIGDAHTPEIVQDMHVLQVPSPDAAFIADRVDHEISAFIGSRAAKEEKTAEIAKRIEVNAAEYVEEAIQSQTAWERRNRIMGVLWHITGFISLVIGIMFAVYGIVRFDTSARPELAETFLLALKTFVVIGLLGACAKYAFVLGKSYVGESLKNSDRIHAISFGRFYLKAYGDKTTWVELKEVFQNWNIDRSSAFTGLEAAEIDPKIIDSAIKLVRAASGNATHKSKPKSKLAEK